MAAIEALHQETAQEADSVLWARSLVYSDRVDNREIALLISEKTSVVADVVAGSCCDREARERIAKKLDGLMTSGALMTADSDIRTASEIIERRAVETDESDPIEFFRNLHAAEGWKFAQIGRETGYDGTVVSRVFSDKYSGDMEAVRTAFASARARILGLSRGAVVRTRTAELVEEFLDEVRSTQLLTVFVGRSGIGKSEAISRYVARNLRRRGAPPIIVHTISINETVTTLLRSIANQLGIDRSVRNPELQGAIVARMIASNTAPLIILDEVNMLRPRPVQACKILNGVRLINDAVRGGVALFGTVNLFDLVYDLNHQAEVDMIRTRVTLAIRLPEPNDREMAALLESHLGEISEAVWLAFKDGLNRYGAEEQGSMRRAATFLHHLRRVREINQAGNRPVTAHQVRATWRRMRNF